MLALSCLGQGPEGRADRSLVGARGCLARLSLLSGKVYPKSPGAHSARALEARRRRLLDLAGEERRDERAGWKALRTRLDLEQCVGANHRNQPAGGLHAS